MGFDIVPVEARITSSEGARGEPGVDAILSSDSLRTGEATAAADVDILNVYRSLGLRADFQEQLKVLIDSLPTGAERDSLRGDLASESLRDGLPSEALPLFLGRDHGLIVWRNVDRFGVLQDSGRFVLRYPEIWLARCVALRDAGYLEAALDLIDFCDTSRAPFADVPDVVVFLRGTMAHQVGDFGSAIRDLTRAADGGETATLRDQAERELLWTLVEAGETEAARERLLRGGSTARLRDSTFVLLLGERLVFEGRAAAAESLYDRASGDFREGPGGVAAFDALAALRAARGDSGDAAFHLRGAEIALAGRAWDAAIRLAARARAAPGADNALRETAALKEGLAYYNGGRNDEAVASLESLRAGAPRREIAREALIHLGRAERRRGRPDASRRHYERFLVEFPDDPFVEEVLWDLGWRDLKARKVGRALDRFHELGRRFPWGKRRPEALLREALAHDALDDPAEAVRDLERLMLLGPDASLGAQAVYFRARFLRALGDKRRASALEDSLVANYPDTFYATYLVVEKGGPEAAWWKAPAGAGDLAFRVAQGYSHEGEAAAARAWIGAQTAGPDSLAPSRRLRRAELLASAGLIEFVEAELVELEAEQPPAPWRDFHLARLYRRYGLHHRALTAGSRFANARRAPRPVEVTRFLFPAAYLDLAVSAASGTDLDPRLLLAVAREESWFEEDVVSRAGAIGLVQILPSTGLALSESLGDPPATPHLLTKPQTSLRLGASYLASLLREFDGSLILAAAAYNGGESNARDWSAFHRAEDPPQSIESISFTETRGYVKKVLRSLWIYRSLYPTASEAASEASR